MIPLRDTIPSRSYPVVNNAIIGLNILIYLIELAQGPELDRFIYIYGLVPARYTVGPIASYFTTGEQFFSFLSFMFLHGGFWHILGNMWFLHIFGDNVEDRVGHLRYLLFYLLCGITSGLSHLFLNLDSGIPTIGASGAIAGVMGAYFLLHPGSRILTLIPILFIPYFIEIPAFLFLGIWFALQFIQAAGSSASISGIAWWAHIGGFVCGMLFLKIFRAIPSVPIADQMRRATAKRRTHHFQMIHPVASGRDPNLYGEIVVTRYEAANGTRKLVNIPWGFQKRIFNVVIPPDVKEGNTLRLKGIGKLTPEGQRGDLLLKVVVRPD